MFVMKQLFSYLLSAKKVLVNDGILVLSLFIANLSNFLFNAILGRSLTFEQFGLITLITSLWTLLNIPFGSLAAAVNSRVTHLHFHKGLGSVINFVHKTQRNTLIFMSLTTFIWVLCVPFLSEFFKVPQVVLFSMSPAFVSGALTFIIRGYFAGTVRFSDAGLVIFFESISKLVVGLLFLNANMGNYAYLAVPVSAVLTLILSVFLQSNQTRKIVSQPTAYAFPRRFLLASITSGLAVTTFLTLDVMLAKHFLSPELAGQYAFLALVGKMIYFLGSLCNSFVITYVTKDVAQGKDPNNTFYRFLAAITGLTTIAYVGVGILGQYTTPILFGTKALTIAPYLPLYGLAIALYTITGYIVLYHLARNHYFFSVIAMIMAGCVGLGMYVYHNTIADITLVLLTVSVINFFVTSLFHFLQRDGEFVVRNVIDLFDAFFPLKDKPIKDGTKRMLIYNWRDTKHMFAGGAEVYIHELAKRWVKEGHSVTVFCGNDSKCPRNEVIDGITIFRRGGFYFVYFWGFLYYLTKFRGKFDYIIDCQNGIPFFTPLYVKEPVVCVMHHVHQEIFRKHLSIVMRSIALILENRLMPLVYRNTQFITVSNSTKIEMEALGLTGAGIEIVHNGIDPQIYKPGIKSKQPLIVYVGRLKYYKTINTFINAAVRIKQAVPEAQFVIAGSGEEKKGLLQLVEKIGADSYITFAGKISDEEKVLLYQQAWIFVNPSSMEGWGITSIEANACGTPVVAADVPGLRDSVQHNRTGLLVAHGKAELFAEAIVDLIQQQEKREAFSEEALSWSKQFHWEASATKFFKVLSSVHSLEKEERVNRAIILTTT
jgi:glycosyltransferase involved in cell wall biosynthesis/O-antigen/teichoic acid export membrane protein